MIKLIHLKIEKSLNSKLDTITLLDRNERDNIVAVLKTHDAIVRGFGQNFFYMSIDNGMLYFKSFNILQEQDDGSIIEVEQQQNPNV